MNEKGLFCGNNKPNSLADMNEFEKKHTPLIDAPNTIKACKPFDVKITVGEISHIMEEAHHVQWIDVYFGENLYARVNLTPVFAKPSVTLTFVKTGKHKKSTLRVIERCNLHGQWEATKEISVE